MNNNEVRRHQLCGYIILADKMNKLLGIHLEIVVYVDKQPCVMVFTLMHQSWQNRFVIMIYETKNENKRPTRMQQCVQNFIVC